MENALLIGLTRQMTLRRSLDVTANNLANMSTAGFKVERTLLAPENAQAPARAADGEPVTFVRDWGLARDFAPGQLEPTQRPLDVAIDGEGFFTVQGPGAETRYTRDGRFTTDGQGQLVTAAGFAVLDDAGRPITLAEDGEPPVITANGAVMAGGQTLGRLGLVDFADTTSLEKAGDGTYRSDAASQPLADPTLRQGYVERSNVNPIEEITRLVEVSRSYESVTRMLSTDEDLKRRAIDKLSSVR